MHARLAAAVVGGAVAAMMPFAAVRATAVPATSTASVAPATSATAAAPRCTRTGTPRADVLVGTPRADVLCGLGGDDRLIGGGGPDLLIGGPGDDVLGSGPGDDVVRAGPGNDLVVGRAGDDLLRGMGGADVVRGGAGDDRVLGERGNDVVRGGRGADRIVGGPGNDRLYGGLRDDLLDSRETPPARDVVTCGAGVPDRLVTDPLDRVIGCGPPAPTNRDPAAVADAYATDEDTTLTVPASGPGSPVENDSDPDGDAVTLTAVGSATGGTVALAGGSIEFVPGADVCGPGGFEYTISDGNGGTDVGEVTVAIACVGDDPVAVDDPATVAEDAAATAVDVLANDTDVDGGPISVGSVTQPADGTAVVTGGGSGLTYEPDPDFCNDPPGTSTDDFTYTLAPGAAEATVSVTVTCVGDDPTAVDDAATVTEDDPATEIDVLANDTDPDGGPRAVGSVTQPANGSAVITGGGSGLSYAPDPDYCNDPPGTSPDTFTYTLAPGGSTATVSVTVTCVNDAPVADDESFTGASAAVGNTAHVVDDPTDGPPSASGPRKSVTGDILDGDTDVDGPSLTVTAGTFGTNDGGSVTIQADGDFVYTPAAGTSCTDTSDFFDYTVSDAGTPPATDTGRVTIGISGCVWYVSNDATGNAGTSVAPFDTLAQADTASPAGDVIFVLDGDDTATGYGGGVDLVANQRLVGEATGLVVDGATLHTAVPGNRPTLTDTDADVVVLDDNNTVTGVALDPAGAGGGIAGGAGDVSGLVADVVVDDTAPFGTQPGVELDSTTGTWNLSDLSVTTSGATGIRLANAGTVNLADAGTTTITTAGARGLDATAGTAFGAGSMIDALTVTGATNGAVSLAGTTGGLALGDGAGVDLDLTTTSGTAAALASSHTGSLAIDAAGTDDVSATGGPALDITAGTHVLALDSVSSTGSASDGINLAGIGSSTLTTTGGSITGAAGIAFDLDGGSGTITYPGTIGNGPGASVDVTNRTGGTTTFSGAITDTADAGGGVTLTGNTGATLRFTGGMGLSTGTTGAFTATGGGTVAVTDPAGATDNTLATTTGTALTVTGTTIGADDLTFRSVSANGAASGVVLTDTGTAGGLTVTGVGSTAQGGDGSGGTIQGTTGPAVSLTGTAEVSLRNMALRSTGDSAVSGTGVSGFGFTDGTIDGAGNGTDEASIQFDQSLTAANLTGTLTVTNNVISNTEADGIEVENYAGTITTATVSDNTLGDGGDNTNPGTAVQLVANGTATTAATLTRVTVADNAITFDEEAGIQVAAGNSTAGGPPSNLGTAGSTTDRLSVTGNTMVGGTGVVGEQADRFFTGGVYGTGQGSVLIADNGTAGNPIRNIDCIGIEVQSDAPGVLTSVVQNNVLDLGSAVGCGGIAVGTGDPSDRVATRDDTVDHATVISGNDVSRSDGPGIWAIVTDSNQSMVSRILNNTVAAPNDGSPTAGIAVWSGSSTGNTSHCLEITGNTTAGALNPDTGSRAPGISLRKQGTNASVNVFAVEGLTPSPTGTPTVENHVNGLNTSASGTFGVGGTVLQSASSGFTACTAP